METIKGSITKCHKISEESKTVELEDRISRLPDNVICHILSSLPTKYAVGTCALSTLWKDQWKLIPHLDFDDTMVMDTSKLDSTDTNIRTSFINFVHRVLDLHKASQISQFRLKCRQLINAEHLDPEALISAVLSRNIQKLELYFHYPFRHSETLYIEAFNSSTLVELSLSLMCILDVSTLVYLPNLKTIYLHHIKFRDNESAKRLFSSCPVLEDLTMLTCMCHNLSIFNISSPTMKRLTVRNPNSKSIELYTPRLEYLCYEGQLAEGYMPKRLESLAKVCFHVPHYLATKETLKAFAQGISLSNVQYLYLSGEVLQKLREFRVEFQPLLVNLRTLAIGYNKHGAWNMLRILLDNCPNLKYLELNDGLFGHESIGEFFHWVPPKVVPACLLLHVEGIKIHEFKGNAQEMEMIKYLLINAKVLKNLTVISAMANAQEETNVRNSLFTVIRERGFKDCQVDVVTRFHV